MRIRIQLFLILTLLNTFLWASPEVSPWYAQEKNKNTIINVKLFLSSTCPHCHKADSFFQTIEPKNPWLHVTRHVINKDKKALTQFYKLLTEQKMDDFAVPSVFFCDSRWVGFVTAETTGKDLMKGINYCKKQIEKNGTLTKTTVNTLKHWANANLFDSSMDEEPKPVSYTTMMALMDAFNPCALFCFIGFLAVLFTQDNHRKSILQGLLFIAAVGLGHYIQQTYSESYFEWLPMLRAPAVFIGLITLYLTFKHYRNQNVQTYFIILTFFLAFMLQAYQQICIMNWSYIFEQWLHNQKITSVQMNLLQMAYQIIYLIPLLLTLFLYLIVSRTAAFSKRRSMFNMIGILYLLTLGLFLIIYPLALSSLALSLMFLILLAFLGWLLYLFKA